MKIEFPIQGQITEDIIKKSIYKNPYKCAGAATLRSVFPNAKNIHWIFRTGEIDGIKVTTEEGIDMADKNLKSQTVTFILKQ